MIKTSRSHRVTLMLTLLVLSFSILSAQTTVTLSDGKFIYRLVVEKLPKAHYRQNVNEAVPVKGQKAKPQMGIAVGTVKSITIFSLKDTVHKQVIIPGKNETAWPWTEDNKAEKFIMEDMNFDGNNDIRLLNSADTYTYSCWLYQPATGQFVKDTVISKMVAPQFDQNQQLVYMNWNGPKDKGTETFKYIDGVLTLIEEEETINNGQKTTIIIKKLVDGKMVVTNNMEIPN